MNRRHFLAGGMAGAATLGAAAITLPGREERPARKSLLKAGHQHHSSDADLRVLAALGVNHICSALPSPRFDDSWSVEGLSRSSDRREVRHQARYGALAPQQLLHQPCRKSAYSDGKKSRARPRDRQSLPNDSQRGQGRDTGREVQPIDPRRRAHRKHARPGRRGVQHFRLQQGQAGTAAEGDRPARRRHHLGTHHVFPQTCRAGGRGEQGAAVLSPARSGHAARQGLSRRRARAWVGRGTPKVRRHHAEQVSRSELLSGHGRGDAGETGRADSRWIRWFGSRGKIFNVHFRNIKGGFLNFQETFPDDGDVDMPRACAFTRKSATTA